MSETYLATPAQPCVVCTEATGYFVRTAKGDVYAHLGCLAELAGDEVPTLRS